MRPDETFASKPAADEFRHDMHVLSRHLQHVCNRIAGAHYPLRRIVKSEFVAFPHSHCGRWFHRIVMLDRCAVVLIDAMGGTGQRFCDVPSNHFRWTECEFGIEKVSKRIFGVDHRQFLVVRDLDRGSGGDRTFMRIGHNQGQILTRVIHLIVGEQEPGLSQLRP